MQSLPLERLRNSRAIVALIASSRVDLDHCGSGEYSADNAGGGDTVEHSF